MTEPDTVDPNPEEATPRTVRRKTVDSAEALASAAVLAQLRLSQIDSHRPFSDQGFDILQESVSEYIHSLALESAKTARRQGGDVVSASDVNQAARYLFRGPARSVLQNVGTIGGVLLGAAISNALALISAQDPSGAGIGVTVALAIIGSFFIAIHLARDIR